MGRFFALTAPLCAVLALQPGPLRAQSAAAPDLPVTSAINREMPRWLVLGGEYRARFDGYTSGKFSDGIDEHYFLNRLRLNLAVKPTGWMRFVFQGQDSRIFGAIRTPSAPPYQDRLDLRLGYAEFGRGPEGPVSVTVGRQDLNFGEKRILGDANWRNVPTAFDAVRLTLRHGAYRLDGFSASAVAAKDERFNHSALDNTIHGLYGTFPVAAWKSMFDAYLLYRIAPLQATESGALARLHSETAGFRWTAALPAEFEYSSEVALQRGTTGGEPLGAWAGHWVVKRPLPGLPGIKAVAEYNYASGDDDPRDGRRGTFDQLYAANHDKYGMADLIGWRNLHHARTAAETKLARQWTAICAYNSFWLASPRDGVYSAAGVLVYRSADGSAGRHVGTELDVQALWTMSPYAQFGFGFAHVFPGGFLKHVTPGASYNSPFITLTTAF
ncbi:MAG: alginate export family protein [Acidobacteriota bacterium]